MLYEKKEPDSYLPLVSWTCKYMHIDGTSLWGYYWELIPFQTEVGSENEQIYSTNWQFFLRPQK